MSEFTEFLTAEDEFRLEMEKYMPEFIHRLKNNTLESDPAFVEKTRELMKLGEAAGIDMQEYILRYGEENGLE